MLSKASHIKLLALDVDGTLTDGGIYVFDTGQPCRELREL